MTSHREFRRNPKTGQYDTDDAALRDALLDLGELVSILMIRLDADQGIDTADLVEVQVRWRDAVEAIDTARGRPKYGPFPCKIKKLSDKMPFPFTDEDLDP